MSPNLLISQSPHLQTTPAFQFRDYQREDLARSALMDGVVFSWEQGLGKTLAAFAWPLLKPRPHCRSVLIVAPGGLHAQITAEGLAKFGIQVRPLNTIADAMAPDLRQRILSPSHNLPVSPSPHLPVFYITSYTALGMNGADERKLEIRKPKGGLEAIPVLPENARRLRLETAPDTDPLAGAWEGVGETREYEVRLPQRGQAAEDAEISEIPDHPGSATSAHCPSAFKSTAPDAESYRLQITCLHRPSLATVVAHAFDCVVCDEATRMKGDTTYLSEGVRKLQPRYRLVLTGTPVKNRLPDIFWLAHWAAGGRAAPTARWPYGDSSEDKARFSGEHLVSERNLTKEARAEAEGTRRVFRKQTAEICGVHRLWKLLAPIVLRRRKADVGDATLVPKRIIPMRVPLGRAQAHAYQWHLSNPPETTSDGRPMARLAAIACQLGILRQSALCPTAQPHGGPRNADTQTSEFTPKNLAVLQIVRECLDRGEPVVVFSPFQHWSQWITATLHAAGVDAIRLDGNTSPKKRGEMAAAFKRGEYPVLVAGMKSMGEGHSFDHCPNLILPSLDWAYDVNAQAIERVHRLTSRRDVRIYTLIAEGTIDERLASLYHEKTEGADLALDGRLFAAAIEEVNLFELLHRAMEAWDPAAATTPESAIAADYESKLRPALGRAMQAWRAGRGSERGSGEVERPLKPAPVAMSVCESKPVGQRFPSRPVAAAATLIHGHQPQIESLTADEFGALDAESPLLATACKYVAMVSATTNFCVERRHTCQGRREIHRTYIRYRFSSHPEQIPTHVLESHALQAPSFQARCWFARELHARRNPTVDSSVVTLPVSQSFSLPMTDPTLRSISKSPSLLVSLSPALPADPTLSLLRSHPVASDATPNPPLPMLPEDPTRRTAADLHLVPPPATNIIPILPYLQRDQQPGTKNQEPGTKNQQPRTRNPERKTTYLFPALDGSLQPLRPISSK